MDFREQIMQLLTHAGVPNAVVEVPPNTELGDFAVPCFHLAKEHKKAPAILAKELAERIEKEKHPFLAKVVATGPYVNFFISPKARAESTITAIRTGHAWQFETEKRRILIEYPSPNTNKPLHLGHVRNMVLGSTLALLLKAAGNT